MGVSPPESLQALSPSTRDPLDPALHSHAPLALPWWVTQQDWLRTPEGRHVCLLSQGPRPVPWRGLWSAPRPAHTHPPSRPGGLGALPTATFPAAILPSPRWGCLLAGCPIHILPLWRPKGTEAPSKPSGAVLCHRPPPDSGSLSPEVCSLARGTGLLSQSH